ncbi:MAG: class I SAM-dependent methyltransferase [Candidatus Limnocylindria bacterium]
MTEAAYYEADELWHPDRYSTDEEQRRLSLAGSMLPSDVTTVADIGCGQGAFLSWLETHRPDLTLFGLERSEAAIRRAVCRTPIAAGSIESLPYQDQQLDAVSVLEVLEHLPYGNYDLGLSELARVTKRLIVISVPYAERRHQVRCPECDCRFHPNYHMRSFDDSNLDNLFPGFMLARREIVPIEDYLGGPLLRWSYRFLRGGADLMPSGGLCPQCGYRKAAEPSLRSRAARHLRHRLPIRKRPNWLIGRYDRLLPSAKLAV